ncbi:alpha/beta hydrolase [uncultured Roseibium sp.]|uniref:alpha/beta fold hydrolase n=1 Tax=uncultured Roseibium sp. TaxID=1936171 RepID=UPI002606CC92|nr:alpha/beta hydrolase [uncultured Roseibium sp.]
MLHYSQSGEREQATIVFLHAAGFDGRIWRKTQELLPDFNCVCPDLPGHGNSRQVPVHDFDAAAEEVANLISSLGKGPIHLAGLSMGSYIGFRLMVRRPDLVKNAVFSGFQHDPIRVSVFIRALMHGSSWMMNSKRNREKMARSLGVADASLVSFKGSKPIATSSTMRKITSLALNFDVSPDLSNVMTPTLVLAGESEHPAILSSLSTFQSELPNCAARVIPGHGHGWIAREPELFADSLRAWFSETPLPDGLTTIAEE